MNPSPILYVLKASLYWVLKDFWDLICPISGNTVILSLLADSELEHFYFMSSI